MRCARKEEHMCPVCLTTLALVTGSAVPAGGVAALVLKKIRTKTVAEKIPYPSEEEHDKPKSN